MRKNRWWLLSFGILTLAFSFLLLFFSGWIVEQRFGWNGVVFGRTSIFVLVLFFMNLSTTYISRFSLFSNKPIPKSLFKDYMNEDF